MKLKLKEDPKEWRKAAWMAALGLAVLGCVLRWRHVLPPVALGVWLGLLAAVAVAAALRPRWFRGHYRFGARLGFGISKVVGMILLGILFFAVVTPLGLIMRLLGKDPLRLRRPVSAKSFWSDAPPSTPLDRLF